MRGLVLALIVLTSGPLGAAPAAADGALVFGVLNQQSPSLTAERWNPILHYLAGVSGVPLALKMGWTVDETNTMMARSVFDLMFTNHNFQSEFHGIGYRGVIARWAGEPIPAAIAAPADSPVRHLREASKARRWPFRPRRPSWAMPCRSSRCARRA